MTKEELEKEAKEYANKKVPKAEMPNMWNRFFKSYLAGAEPREKRIAELEAQIEQEKNLNQVYEDNNRQLREMIKKMKRHCNCKHRDSEGYCEVKKTYLVDLSYNGCDKWELED